MTKHMTAAEIAARLWPPPDPVNYCRREAIGRIAALDRALKAAMELRARAGRLIFGDLSRLWIKETDTETLLRPMLSELQTAVRELDNALGLLSAARTENSIRFCDERLLERQEQRAEP